MKRFGRRRASGAWIALAIGGMLASTLSAAHARRDEPQAPSPAAAEPTEASPPRDDAASPESAATAVGGSKSGGRPARRLPTHYNKLVTSEQREKIYRIQDRYQDKIALLEAKLAELKSGMAREIEGVLTPEQREQLKELRKGTTR